jgi:hypothetical protein
MANRPELLMVCAHAAVTRIASPLTAEGGCGFNACLRGSMRMSSAKTDADGVTISNHCHYRRSFRQLIIQPAPKALLKKPHVLNSDDI